MHGAWITFAVLASAGPKTVNLSDEARATHNYVAAPVQQPDFSRLTEAQATAVRAPGPQQGSVLPGTGLAADVNPNLAVEDIPGNAYPRKHTVYMNFTGGMLYSGADNSAEDKSTLAKQGIYPAFDGGEAKAVASVQAFENDVAAFGIRTVYLERPPKTLPYTMVMIGGSWTDTNLEDPAGGVAPGTDCGALGQRHVVYVFANAGWSATQIGNVTSQEAGHAWGLDHSRNCSSVMAYCGGGDQLFSNTCDSLCPADECQGDPGCRVIHEQYCGPGSEAQNEVAELSWIFGGNEPDLEPPIVQIQEPQDGAVLPFSADVNLRAVVDDNYGGFGWRFIVEHDGEVVYDQPDYERDVDAMYRAALNFEDMPPGTWVFTVEAMDHGDFVVSDSVTVTVQSADDSGGSSGGEEPSTSSGSSTTEDETTGPATTSTTGEATTEPDPSSTGGDTDTAGVATDDGGCSCSSGPRSMPVAPLLLVSLLGVRRRRAG